MSNERSGRFFVQSTGRFMDQRGVHGQFPSSMSRHRIGPAADGRSDGGPRAATARTLGFLGVTPTQPRPRANAGVALGVLAARLGLTDVAEPLLEVRIGGVTHDSRAVRPGDLYAALPGSAPTARSSPGRRPSPAPSAILTDPRAGSGPAGAGLPVLVVPDPRAVLGQVAAGVYGRPADALRCLGVTGTNGKTTTAFLLEAGLRAAGHTTGLLGTVETRVSATSHPQRPHDPGGPRPARPARRRCASAASTAVAMEVSSHALALHRVDGVRLRRRAVHQPVAGPPGLPPRRSRPTSRPRRAVHPGARRGGRGQRRRRVGSAAGWSTPGSRCTTLLRGRGGRRLAGHRRAGRRRRLDVHAARPGRRPRRGPVSAAGRLQRRQRRWARSRPWSRPGSRCADALRGGRRLPWCSGPDGAGRLPVSRSSPSSTTRTPRTPSPPLLAALRPVTTRPADRRARLPAATATAASGR